MQPQYYLLISGHREGPYREEELLDLWTAGEVSPRQLCEQIPSGEQRRLEDWFERIEPEIDDNEEFDPPPIEELLWEGRPALFAAIGRWVLAGGVIWMGFHYATPGPLIAGLILGALLLLSALWRRLTESYRITTHQVEVCRGLWFRSHRILRIAEIRSIQTLHADLPRWFGVGTIHFHGDVPLTFYRIAGVRRVLMLVRQLPNFAPVDSKNAG